MALVQIQPTVRRRDEESGLTKIAAALNIAQSALGTALAVPKFLQERKLGKLQEAKSTTDIMQETEAAKPGDQDAFKVPGVEGLRKAAPSLAREIEKMNLQRAKSQLQDQERRSKVLTDAEKQEIANFAVANGADKIPGFAVPETKGEAEDFINRIIGRTMVTPLQQEQLSLSRQNVERQSREETARREKEAKEEQAKQSALEIPMLGQRAKSQTDANEIKDNIDAASNILGNLEKLQQLKSKYPLGAIPIKDAADIAEARQLSTDLLLQYKTLAKLGVLSQSDLTLIERLVPSNPLAPDLSAAIGDSPIMRQLQQLQNIVKTKRNAFIKNKGLDFAPLLSDQELEEIAKGKQ